MIVPWVWRLTFAVRPDWCIGLDRLDLHHLAFLVIKNLIITVIRPKQKLYRDEQVVTSYVRSPIQISARLGGSVQSKHAYELLVIEGSIMIPTPSYTADESRNSELLTSLDWGLEESLRRSCSVTTAKESRGLVSQQSTCTKTRSYDDGSSLSDSRETAKPMHTSTFDASGNQHLLQDLAKCIVRLYHITINFFHEINGINSRSATCHLPVY